MIADLDKSPPIACAISSPLLIVVGVTFLYAWYIIFWNQSGSFWISAITLPLLVLNTPFESGVNSNAVSAIIDGAKKGSSDLTTKDLAELANNIAVFISVFLPCLKVCIAALTGAATSAYGTRYEKLLAFHDRSSFCCVTGIRSDAFSYGGANLSLYALYISFVIPVILCAASITTGVAIPTVVVQPISCRAPICLM